MKNPSDTASTALALSRKEAMRLYAGATIQELASVVETFGPPEVQDVRPAEAGLVMVRGRMGGTGKPFNAGEASVVRCVVRLCSGETGISYQLGRDRTKARLAAILDALWQSHRQPDVEAALAPIRERIARDRLTAARRAAATKVDFFTLVRGED